MKMGAKAIETEDNEMQYTVPVKQGMYLFTVPIIKKQKQHYCMTWGKNLATRPGCLSKT